MSNVLVRILVAVIVAVLLNALLLPVSRLLGFPLSGDLLLVFRVCIAGLLVLYVIRGWPGTPAAAA